MACLGWRMAGFSRAVARLPDSEDAAPPPAAAEAALLMTRATAPVDDDTGFVEGDAAAYEPATALAQ